MHQDTGPPHRLLSWTTDHKDTAGPHFIFKYHSRGKHTPTISGEALCRTLAAVGDWKSKGHALLYSLLSIAQKDAMITLLHSVLVA
jgi:hypothetical protein